MYLSIVTPVFNEEEVLPASFARMRAVLDGLVGQGAIERYEIVFVDDGSRDRTLPMLLELAAQHDCVRVVELSRNFGHQPALSAGLLEARGDVVVSIDADLQDPPEVIAEMLASYRQGHDVVYAARRRRDQDTFFKRCTARGFYRLMRAMGAEVVHDHADFRLLSRPVIEAFREVREYHLFLRGIFPYLGFRSAIVEYDREERYAGESKYPLRKMLRFAWNGITSFSNVPLRAASVTGFSIFLGSLLMIAWVLWVWARGEAVPGWASTVIPIIFIGGLNILFLGLIGEYVGKMYIEVKRRPPYVIRKLHGFPETGA